MPEIEHLFEQLRGFKIPPVAQWQPRETLDIGLRIAADGRWYYQESVIERRRIVQLFGSVLRLEPDGRYCLVTPRLKYPVTVEDAPFQAVELHRQGTGRAQKLVFRTNLDDVVPAGRDHPIQVTTDPRSGQPSPYVEVRDGLRAKICRPVYYELAQLLEPAAPAARGDGDATEDDQRHRNRRGDARRVQRRGVFSLWPESVTPPVYFGTIISAACT